jgi:phosphatidylinositol alpha 1,6-mannosyltransferase
MQVRSATASAPGPLRIALFAEQGHPDGTFRSGVTRLTDHIVNGCAARGVPLDFFTYHGSTGSDDTGMIRYVGVEPRAPVVVHGLRVDALDLLPTQNPRFVRPAEGFEYDLVLATSPGIGTQGQLLAHRRGIPFVAIHTTDLPHYAAELARARSIGLPGSSALSELARAGVWAYLRWLYDARRTDLVLVPTYAARRDLLARVHARAEVLGRGADTMSFSAVERPRRSLVRLLYVGRIDYGQKNLAALERVVREVDDVELSAVGDGDDLPSMRSRLADLVAAGRVHLTGRIDDIDRLKSIYLASDVFVFPSLHDTLGQVVLEAQRAGLPVVVRERGGPQELVSHGETGFVATSDTELVERVRQLAGDALLRARMGKAARAHAAAMPTWDEVVTGLLARLERLALPGWERRHRRMSAQEEPVSERVNPDPGA